MKAGLQGVNSDSQNWNLRMNPEDVQLTANTSDVVSKYLVICGDLWRPVCDDQWRKVKAAVRGSGGCVECEKIPA